MEFQKDGDKLIKALREKTAKESEERVRKFAAMIKAFYSYEQRNVVTYPNRQN